MQKHKILFMVSTDIKCHSRIHARRTSETQLYSLYKCFLAKSDGLQVACNSVKK